MIYILKVQRITDLHSIILLVARNLLMVQESHGDDDGTHSVE